MEYEILVKEYKLKLKENPYSEELMCKLANALIETGDNGTALNLLRKATDANPNVRTLTNLGYFLLSIGEPKSGRWFYCPEKAVSILEKAISLNPSEHYPYSALGEAYLKLNMNDSAISVLSKSIKIKGIVANHNNYGVALHRKDRFRDAANQFYMAHVLNERKDYSYYPLYNYASCLVNLNQNNEAMKIAEQLMELLEDNFAGEVDSIDIARLFYLCNQYDKVVNLFREAYEFFLIQPLDYGIYLYSLYQVGMMDELSRIHENAMLGFQDKINDINNDIFMVNDRKESELLRLGLEKDQYEKYYKDVINGICPVIINYPYIETDCYFYGCIRHNNPY